MAQACETPSTATCRSAATTSIELLKVSGRYRAKADEEARSWRREQSALLRKNVYIVYIHYR